MKSMYYAPTILVDHVEPYCVVMETTQPPKDENPVKPGGGTPTAPARMLYV